MKNVKNVAIAMESPLINTLGQKSKNLKMN